MDQSVISIPSENLFSTADGHHFMLSLPMDTGDSSQMVNVPFFITTTDSGAVLEGNNATVSLGDGSTDNTGNNLLFKSLDSGKHTIFLDGNQLSLLSDNGEQIVLTGTDQEIHDGLSAADGETLRLIFAPDDTSLKNDQPQTTYITNVVMPEVAREPAENEVIQSLPTEISRPPVVLRRPGRPRKEHTEVLKPPIGKGPYRCEICNLEFSRWAQMKRHHDSHKDDKPHRCPHCPDSFNVQTNLELHISTHAKGPPWRCSECSRKFARLASLKAHIIVHEREESLFCQQCGEEYRTQVQLDKHSEEHVHVEKVQPLSCKYCQAVFKNKSQLQEHLREHAKRRASLQVTQHRKISNKKTQFPYKCLVCKKGFTKPSQMLRHHRIHSGEKPFKCKECDQRFTQKGSLLIHTLKHNGHRPYECDFCPSKFAQRGNLRSHISRVHMMPGPGQQVFRCHSCACVFRKLGSLNAHVSRLHANSMNKHKKQIVPDAVVSVNQEHGSSEEMFGATPNSDILQQAINKSGLQQSAQKAAEEDPNEIREVKLSDSLGDNCTRSYVIRMRKQGGVRWHQCLFCTKEFKKPSDLIRHMRIHTNEKPYQCKQCHRSFAVKSTLTAHQHTHTQLKLHTCKICNQKYASSSSLAVHMRLHEGLKPYDCKTCGRKFRTTGHRASHLCLQAQQEKQLRRELMVKKRKEVALSLQINNLPPLQDPLVVTERGLMVVSKKKGAGPDQSAENKAQRPYECKDCGCRFKKSSHLKQHEMSHKGIKPYACQLCSKNFVSSGVMKAHMLTHEKLHPFKCNDCDQTYTTKGSLKRHLSSHSALKPYICPYCQRDFKTSANCRKHIKIHAKEVLYNMADPVLLPTVQPMQVQSDMPPLQESLLLASGTVVEPEATEETLQHKRTSSSIETSLKAMKESRDQVVELPPSSLETHTDTVITSGGITRTITLPEMSGPLTQESLRKLEENINRQIMASDQMISDHQTITLSDQTILTLTTQPTELTADLNLNKSSDFPLLSDQASGANNGLVAVCGSVEGVYIQGFDSHALDTALFSGGIPIQTDPLELGALSNILASTSTQHEPPPEDDMMQSCYTCKKAFPSESSLQEHIKLDHTFPCTTCRRTFHAKLLLNEHMLTHLKQKKKNECSDCGLTFKTATQLKTHGKRAHKKKGFPTKLQPQGELPSAPTLTTISTKRPGKTKASTALRVSKDDLSKVLNYGPELGTLSEQVLAASIAEKDHVSEIKDVRALAEPPSHPNVCAQCPKSFKKPSDLQRHIRTHTGERPYACSQCCRAFTVKSTLISHWQTHRKDTMSGIPCHLCGSHFATKGSLRVHMRLHTGSRPLKCPHCEQCFRTSGHRKAHMMASHSKKDMPPEMLEEYQVPEESEPQTEPETEMDVESDPVVHELSTDDHNPHTDNIQLLPIQLDSTELIHLDENILQQLQAGNLILQNAEGGGPLRFEVFSDASGQQIVNIAGDLTTEASVEKPMDKVCETCGKSFAKPSQLARHTRIHTGEKPFGCLLCPKRFNQKNALNTHLLMHSGHKPHKCDQCGKWFSQAGNLRTHVRRTHPELY